MNASILQDDRKALDHVLLKFDAMGLSDVQCSAVYSNIMMFAVEYGYTCIQSLCDNGFFCER